MDTRSTLIVSRSQVMRFLSMREGIAAVEAAFAAWGEGQVQMPPKTYLHFDRGDLRAMPAYGPALGLASVKLVNVHPHNSDLPAVMALVALYDPQTGFPLALMDGTYLTAVRTGAAGAVAAKHLARPDSRVASFVGAGRQAEAQLAALAAAVPSLERVLVHDAAPERAEAFARGATAEHGLSAEAVGLEKAVRTADILTTVTPSRAPVVRAEWVRPGTHINAIGADAPGKQELDPAVLLSAKLVVDDWEQASHGGEINVAVSRGLLTRDDVHANIGEVVTGRRPGRETDDEITVFDSTGLAVQDLACAAHVYRRLAQAGHGPGRVEFDFLSDG